MSLEEKLAAIREAGAKRMPEEVRAVMGAATKELAESGILDTCIQAGDALPAFSLPNSRGETVNSADLLAKGPVVMTVYRGEW